MAIKSTNMEVKEAIKKLKEFYVFRTTNEKIPLQEDIELQIAIHTLIQEIECRSKDNSNENDKSGKIDARNIDAFRIAYRTGWKDAMEFINKTNRNTEGISTILAYDILKEIIHDKDKCMPVTNDSTKEQTKPLKETD